MRNQLNPIFKPAIIGVLVLVLGCSLIPSQSAEENKPELCQGNYQSEEEAKEQLARFAKSYSNLQEWKARAELIRILKEHQPEPLDTATEAEMQRILAAAARELAAHG